MSPGTITDAELFSWIEKSLNTNGFKNYDIKVSGKSEKGDGYLGDIVFVSIIGTTNDNKKETLHWVVKHGKRNDHLRNTFPMKAAFDNEINFYSNILPSYKQFQLDKNIQDVFDSVPKCFSTLILDHTEVLLLDDLKQRGYELYDRKLTFNTCHLKAVLKEYGKLHALSFALKAQKTEDFNKLVELSEDVLLKFFQSEGMRDALESSIEKTLSLLKEKNELYLFKKLEEILVNDPLQTLMDLMMEKYTESVLIHGDSWNNNFMFKYENGDRSTPTKLAILDWQLTTPRSPVFDLLYLIYATSSSHELGKIDELLQFYYTSFSNFLKELGNNPEEFFSFSSLKAHWKKYSLFGLIMSLLALPIAICNKEDAPVFENLQEGEKFSDMIRSNVKDSELFFKRIKPVIKHYFEYSCK